MQSAPDQSVHAQRADGAPAHVTAGPQDFLSHVFGSQDLQLKQGLDCSLTLTQHVLGEGKTDEKLSVTGTLGRSHTAYFASTSPPLASSRLAHRGDREEEEEK